MTILKQAAAEFVRAGRDYLLVSLCGAVLVFCGVQAWRLVQSHSFPDVFPWLLFALAVARINFRVGLPNPGLADVVVRGRAWRHRLTGISPGLIPVVVGVIGFYGLFSSIRAVVPSAWNFDPWQAAYIAMSLVLIALIAFDGSSRHGQKTIK